MKQRIDALLDGIRAFEVLVEDVAGRFKLSQNRSAEDRRNIIDRLRGGGSTEQELADLMERELRE
jgi:transcriptional regulator